MNRGGEKPYCRHEVRFTHRDGDYRWIQVYAQLTRDRAARLDLFFTQSLDGFFFMMLDEPVTWDETVDKDQTLDYVFRHQRITKVNEAMLAQYGLSERCWG